MIQPRLFCLFLRVLLGTAGTRGQEASKMAGKAASFDEPLVTMADIKARRVQTGKRVRIRAVLAKQGGPQVYLVGEDANDAQVNNLRPPFPVLREGGSGGNGRHGHRLQHPHSAG